MRRWALVLHFYQPPVQDLAITKQVLESSYLPVLKVIEEHPRARVTVNISACLLQQLRKLQKDEFFVSVRRLVAMGKVELLSGPAYHPIVPMVRREIFERQVQKSGYIYTDTLGIQPGQGVFLPELAVTPDVMSWVKAAGFKYTVVDAAAVGSNQSMVISEGVKCYVNCRPLTDIIRAYPGRLSAAGVAKWLKTQPGQKLVSVNDVEAFGHHYEERVEVLKGLFDDEELGYVTLGEMNMSGEEGEIYPSSWQEAEWTVDRRGPFWVWDNPENPLQQSYKKLGDMAAHALALGEGKTEGYTWNAAAEHLDMGLSSCYLYWLSNWPWWHPELVERGAQQLIKCVRTVEVDREVKQQAEQVYHGFMEDLWMYHWSGRVEEKYREFESEREKLVLGLPSI